jgi:NDP-sugar pyrophosphorylase family protein
MPVAGLPAASWIARSMARASIREVAVNLHHLPGQVKRVLGDGSDHGVRVTYSPEPGRILGTGGGIRRAAEVTSAGELLVANGDVISDLDLAALVDHHRRSGADATLALVARDDHARFGTVELDAGGRVRSIAGHGPGVPPGAPTTRTVFTGVHVLGERAIRSLPPAGCVVRRTYFEMLDAGMPLAGYLHEGYWNDIGTPAAYHRCSMDIVRGRAGRLRPPRRCDRGRLVHPGAHVDPGARLAADVVVGAGAVVLDGAYLERCIVWDGARVAGHHEGEVITRRHVVKVEA